MPRRAPSAASGLDFASLVRQHQAMVFSIAWHLLRDRAVAEELAQDVFLSLYQHLAELESPEHVQFWLRRDFGSLVRQHQAMVFSIAWHLLRDRAVAEELAQDVFLSLYQHLAELESPGAGTATETHP